MQQQGRRRRGREKMARDARELAVSPVANPYRGQLADPYCDTEVPPQAVLLTPRGTRQTAPAVNYPPPPMAPPNRASAPGEAVTSGVLAIIVGIMVGIFGLVLLTILSFQNEFGAPDRSFYRGTDSSYVLLALVDFALAACVVTGAIGLMSGRVAGRVAMTVGCWTVLVLCAFWYLGQHAPRIVPVTMAVLAAAALLFGYQRSVTRWLGVLPPPQPE